MDTVPVKNLWLIIRTFRPRKNNPYVGLLGLLVILGAAKCSAQSGITFDYVAVEVPVYFTVQANGTSNVTYVVPIPANPPRSAWCFYRVGVDYNTNFPVWITPTNTVYIFRTNFIAQVPATVWQTSIVTRTKLAKASLTKTPKLTTTLKNVAPSPIKPPMP